MIVSARQLIGKQCGEPTCYSFALRLAASQLTSADCSPLFEPHQVKKLSALSLLAVNCI
jgi:ArsR family metal-binding transcriptional regulator